MLNLYQQKKAIVYALMHGFKIIFDLYKLKNGPWGYTAPATIEWCLNEYGNVEERIVYAGYPPKERIFDEQVVGRQLKKLLGHRYLERVSYVDSTDFKRTIVEHGGREISIIRA